MNIIILNVQIYFRFKIKMWGEGEFVFIKHGRVRDVPRSLPLKQHKLNI